MACTRQPSMPGWEIGIFHPSSDERSDANSPDRNAQYPAYPYPKMPSVLMGRKKTLPMLQKMGHWRPRWRAAAAWPGDEGGGKSTRSAGTPMKDCVMALPCGVLVWCWCERGVDTCLRA